MEEGVLGLPPGLEGKREELTPMLTQYAELCLAYEDALVLFQVGDFYEAFCEAAEAVSRELEITLTKREDSTGTYPMAGIPIDNAQSYLERLLEAGYRVAIADQVQDPADSTGPVDRAVTRVLTPGTVIDEELLEPGSSNYVACLAGSGAGTRDGTDANDGDGSDDADTDDDPDPDDTVGNGGGSTGEEGSKGSEERSSSAGYAVAFADVSTGEFLLTSGSRDTVADELDRFDPAEVLFAPEIGPETFDRRGTARPPREGTFGYENAADRVTATGGSLADLTMSETRACGALLAYIEYTRGDASEAGATHDGDDSAEDVDENRSGSDGEANVDRDRFGAISRYEPAEFLRLDATALRSLEVFDDRSGGEDHTLFSVLDDASCALGRRRLAGWLRRPLLDVEAIEARHDAVSELLTDSLVREELRELLRDVYDLSRLSTRVSRGRANARDLRSLADTLGVVPHVREALSGADSGALAELRAALEDCGDVRGLIERAIRPDPPIEITEGGLIEPGFDDGLDSLRETEQGGKEWVAELEASERERTGIDSLSVGFNQVHGYYIEVTKANLEDVPEEYTRRQTLKNAERFYTPDLKRREEEILSAGERADEREYELFGAVRAQVGAEADRIDRIADVFADLDVFCTLAAVASERDYVRPAVGCETLSLRGGRHPVVEEVQGSFVPNDVSLGTGEVGIITGPNMAGKSTYMRQVALCSLLAQIGSFVPAREAQLPIVDRIFTRIGASDDIAGGQSTFMREMTELATILREASEDSLVILDEVGRGTSTADGRAIARAAIEGLHDAVGARTLFATHYHELTDLAAECERVSNYHFVADREGGEVTFLYSVAAGAAAASYGIDVAHLAGVPEGVVDRSHDLVAGETARTTAGDDGDDTEESGRSDPAVNGHRSTEKRSTIGTEATTGPTNGGRAGGDALLPDDTLIPTRNGAEHGTRERNDATRGVSNDGKRRGTGATTDRGIETTLRTLDIANTTPIEALFTLNELKNRLDDEPTERHGTD